MGQNNQKDQKGPKMTAAVMLVQNNQNNQKIWSLHISHTILKVRFFWDTLYIVSQLALRKSHDLVLNKIDHISQARSLNLVLNGPLFNLKNFIQLLLCPDLVNHLLVKVEICKTKSSCQRKTHSYSSVAASVLHEPN